MSRPHSSRKYDWFISMAFELSGIERIIDGGALTPNMNWDKPPASVTVSAAHRNLVSSLAEMITHALIRDAAMPAVPVNTEYGWSDRTFLYKECCLDLARLLAHLPRVDLLSALCQSIATHLSLYCLSTALPVADELRGQVYGQEVRAASVPLLAALIKRLSSNKPLEDYGQTLSACWAQTHKLTCACLNCRQIARFLESPSMQSLTVNMDLVDFSVHFNGKTLTSEIVDPCPSVQGFGNTSYLTKNESARRQNLIRLYQAAIAQIDGPSASTIASSVVLSTPTLSVMNASSGAAPLDQLG